MDRPVLLACCLVAITGLLSLQLTPARAEGGPGAMSAAEGRNYLRSENIDPLPENLVQQIVLGRAKAVDAMIAAGVDVNAKGSLPQSPLELAAMSCSNHEVAPETTAHMVDALVAAGADPNAPGVQGLGPLMIASQQCGALVVQHLVKAGAKLDSRTPQGFTPLSMALITKHYDAAKALIDAGARISPDAAHKLTDGSDDDRLKQLVQAGTAR